MRQIPSIAALVLLAACDDQALRQQKEDWDSVHHAAVLLTHARITCHASEAEMGPYRAWIDSQVRRNGDLAEAAVKGADEAEAQFAEALRDGKVDSLRRAACPGIWGLIDKVKSERSH